MFLFLDRVGARTIGLPGVHDRARQRLVQGIGDLAMDQHNRTVAAFGQVGTQFLDGRVVQVERPQVRSLRRAAAGVQHVDQRGKAQNVGKQNEFMPLGRGDLPAIVKEV